MEKFYRTPAGVYIGSYIGGVPDPQEWPGAIEVASAPPNAWAIYTNGAWTAVVKPQQVDIERNRRMTGTMIYAGHSFDVDEKSVARITGAATLAGFAVASGAQPGNLYWHGGQDPFTWIAADNSFVEMDAQTMFGFGQAAAANVSAHIFSARLLKDMNPIPPSFANNSNWP